MMLTRRIVLAGALVLGFGLAGSASAEEFRLKAMSSFPEGFPETQSFKTYLARLTEASKGALQFDFVGGPEAIPRPQQGGALKSGVIDILYSAPTQAAGIFPESHAFSLSHLSPMERRKSGGHDLVDEVHQKRMNAKYLLSPDGGIPLYVFLSKEPKRNADGSLDLGGFKLRSSEMYIPFFQELGTTPVVLGPGDIYTALERGTVDGIGWSATGVNEGGWTRFLKYWIEPPMYWTSTSITMNLDTWNRLPPELQRVIEEVSLAYEKESYETSARQAEEAKEGWRKAGMQPITLEGEAAKRFVDLAFGSAWKANVEDNSAIGGLDLEHVLAKYYGR